MKRSRCTIVIPCNAILVLLFALLSLATAPTDLRAQGHDREIEAAKKRIHGFVEKAKAYEREGKREAAQELRHMAAQLKERLGKAAARKRKDSSNKEWYLVLRNLELGIGALKKLGKREEAGTLAEIARGLRQRLEYRGDRERDERQREGHGRSEREVAKRHLAILRYAKGALAEAGKRDLAEEIELAMHARELALEGNRGEKAERITKRAPNSVNLAEILMYSAKLLKEFRATEKAGAVRELANHLLEGHRRRDKNRRREEHGGGHDERRHGEREHGEREHREPGRDSTRRIERLEKQLAEMQETLRQLRRNQGERRRRR